MTTQQDVENALNAYAQKQQQKAIDRKVRINQFQTELNNCYNLLRGWVYRIEGVKAEMPAATSLLSVDNVQCSWNALSLGFAGTSIIFQPELHSGALYLAVQGLWGADQKFLLKPEIEKFAVYNESLDDRRGTLTKEVLFEEIISITEKLNIS